MSLVSAMSSDLQLGTIFAGRYRVDRRIAAGGMGAVYEVIHLETDRRRALKVMLPHVLQSDALRERFKAEAKVAARIESEHIVEVFDAGVDEATSMPFLVMELLRGEELGKRLKRLGRFAPADVVTYLHQTALALDKTHRASIVHRDLKPENLFLTERDEGPPRVKVLDFGVAKVVAESATAGATQSIGTPFYMSPEQFNPRAQLTGCADIYALGMVAYTFLVGAPYWLEEGRGGNVFALAAVAMHGPNEAGSARAARLGVGPPPGFDAWFARATAPRPEQRFPTATEAVRALADALGVSRAPLGSLSEVTASAAPIQVSMPVPPAHAVVATVPLQATPAPITGPATSATPEGAPRSSRVSLILGGAIVGGALLGVAIFVGTRHGEAPSGSAPSSAAPSSTVSAAPAMTSAAPAVVPTVFVSATASASAAPVSASASAAAPPKPSAKPHATAAPLYSRE